MKIKCLFPTFTHLGTITKGKTYEVIQEGKNCYKIKDDINAERWVMKNRFEKIEEYGGNK